MEPKWKSLSPRSCWMPPFKVKQTLIQAVYSTVNIDKIICCIALCMSSFVPWWYQKYVDCVATDEEDMFFDTPDIDPTILLQVTFIKIPKIWRKKSQSLFLSITLWGDVISGEGFRFSHTCVFTFLWIFTIL